MREERTLAGDTTGSGKLFEGCEEHLSEGGCLNLRMRPVEGVDTAAVSEVIHKRTYRDTRIWE